MNRPFCHPRGSRHLLAALALVLLVVAGGLSAARDDVQTTLVHPPFGHCLGMHRATALEAICVDCATWREISEIEELSSSDADATV